MFFRKKNKRKSEYKGIPVGVMRGFRFGSVMSYYCTNCYFGVKYNSLVKGDKKCPKCNALLNWDDMIDGE